MGWFFVAVGVADFDCGFGGDSFCGDVEFAVFVGGTRTALLFRSLGPRFGLVRRGVVAG